MDKFKKKHIESLIKESSLDRAPKSFTDSVMQNVSILSNEVELKDPKLSKLLKSNLMEQPSYHFKNNIMNVVQVKKEKAYKPIIGRNTWAIIACSFFISVIYIILNKKPSSETSLISSYLEKVNFSSLSFDLNISSILVFSLFALSTLLFLDYFLRQKSVV